MSKEPKKAESKSVAIISTNSSLERLKNELASLTKISETPYKTDGKIDGIPSNIQQETNIANLIKMYGSVKERARAYKESAEELQINTFPQFNLNGNTLESYKHDIQLKIAIITIDERRKQLEGLVKEGEEFLTKEDKYEAYLKRLADAGLVS